MDITIQELEVFTGVTQLKSLRALARRNHLKPAHVSKIIRRLEGKVGEPLLKRSTSGVVLTEVGTRLLGPAEAILEQAKRLRASPLPAPHAEKKVIAIGANSFLLRYLLCPSMDALGALDPGARLRLVELTHNNVVPLGLEGAFEMALHVGPLEWTRLWISRNLGEMRWVLAAGYAHPLPQVASAQDVRRFPFVVPTDWRFQRHREGEDFCPIPIVERDKGWEITTPDTAIEVICNSRQLAFLPEIAVRDAIRANRVKEIRVEGWPAVERPIFLSVRSDRVTKRWMQGVTSALAGGMKG